MQTLITVIHYAVCAFLIIVVLLQAGKGADVGAFFGGGSSTLFGSRGAATFLAKLTTGAAILFLITSLSLSSLARQRSRSVLTEVPAPATQTTPATTPALPTTPTAPEAPAVAPETAPTAPQQPSGETVTPPAPTTAPSEATPPASENAADAPSAAPTPPANPNPQPENQ